MKNLDKILQYLDVLAIEPVQVDDDIHKRIVTKLRVNPSIFNVDGCSNCGGCCVAEHNVYTQHEYDYIMSFDETHWVDLGFDISYLKELKEGIEPENHVVNGKAITVYAFNGNLPNFFLPHRGREMPRCHWLISSDEKRRKEEPTDKNLRFFCKIHPVTSITCKMPHLRFLYNSRGTLTITVTQFGRNWAMMCPVEFAKPVNEEQFEQVKQSRIEKFRILERCANDLNIKTYISQLIDYINSIPYSNGEYEKYLGVDIIPMLQGKKLFNII